MPHCVDNPIIRRRPHLYTRFHRLRIPTYLNLQSSPNGLERQRQEQSSATAHELGEAPGDGGRVFRDVGAEVGREKAWECEGYEWAESVVDEGGYKEMWMQVDAF